MVRVFNVVSVVGLAVELVDLVVSFVLAILVAPQNKDLHIISYQFISNHQMLQYRVLT